MNQDFDEYKKECLQDIQVLQDEFINLYSINDYPDWFYDHGMGVFTFKSESNNLYFRYVDVGSYSRNTNTWLWAWNNKNTPIRVTRGLEKVKLFGKEHSYTELYTGMCGGDEYTGWAMTAITAKLLNGFGVYRVVVDHLEIYFVFIDNLSQEQVDDIKENTVACDEHGTRKAAFVCQHLSKNSITGFHESFPSDPEDELEEEDYQGWCDLCEEEWQKEGEWNEKSMDFSKIKLVCDQCYFEIKEQNLGYKAG